MAEFEKRNYTITIKASSLEGQKSAIAGDNKQSPKEQGKDILSKGETKKIATALVAYQTVKSFATQIVNHEVSLIQLRTGSNELQARANHVNQMAQKTVGIIEGVAMGGMVGGPVGAAVGLVAGLASEWINYSQAVNRINTQKGIEDIGIGMNSARAGYNGSRRL